MENNNDTGERKGLKNINWNKLAIILILLGVGMLAIGRLSGSRGGMIAFENGRLRVLQDEQSDFTPLPRSREITHIAVNATYANIIIETTPPGETDGIHFTNISPEYFDVSDGKITIDSRPVGRRWVLFQLSPGRREIRINLPPGTEIWEIETRTVSGGIRFYNLQAREVVAVATSGSVRSENSDFGNTYLRSTSGAVNLSGFTWENLQAQSTSGSVRISDGEIRSATGATGAAGVAGVAGETRLQSTSGSVNMELRGTAEDFRYDLSSTSGTVRVNGERRGRSAASFTGDHLITMRAVSGGVRLDFNE